jgi:tetratricopeptide (TPR) repeat protein
MSTSKHVLAGRLTAGTAARSMFLWVAFALGSLPAAATHAADREREPDGYRAAIDAAVQEFELNHFAESREQFARAHALYPNARTLRGLGVADFELRRYVQAVQELEAALAHHAKRLDGGVRAETEELLGRARAYVGAVQLALEPADATILVDGEPVPLHGGGQLMLEVGDHQLEISAPGRATQRRSLRVHGQHQTLRIELAAAEPATPPPQGDTTANAKTPEPAAHAEPRRRRVVTWALGGLTLAAAGTLVGLAIATENTEDALQDCLEAEGLCDHLAEKGARLERARNAMIGVASAAVVATVVSFFVEGRGRSGSQVTLRFSPTGAHLLAAF